MEGINIGIFELYLYILKVINNNNLIDQKLRVYEYYLIRTTVLGFT
ncbi:hypothetical protein GCM10009110_20330 [Psychrobacter piscatorii]